MSTHVKSHDRDKFPTRSTVQPSNYKCYQNWNWKMKFFELNSNRGKS